MAKELVDQNEGLITVRSIQRKVQDEKGQDVNKYMVRQEL